MHYYETSTFVYIPDINNQSIYEKPKFGSLEQQGFLNIELPGPDHE